MENKNKNKPPPFPLCNELCTADLVELGNSEFGFQATFKKIRQQPQSLFSDTRVPHPAQRRLGVTHHQGKAGLGKQRAQPQPASHRALGDRVRSSAPSRDGRRNNLPKAALVGKQTQPQAKAKKHSAQA